MSLSLCCNDIWQEKETKLDKNLYVIYSPGDGFRLAQKISPSNYNQILPTPISQLYRNKGFLIIKTFLFTQKKNAEYYEVCKSSDSTYTLKKISCINFKFFKQGSKKIIDIDTAD